MDQPRSSHLNKFIVPMACAEDSRYIPTALPAYEVIYFQTRTDSLKQTLDASKGDNYTITFPLPLPAKSFWSLTIYNATSLLLFPSATNRYNIADRVSAVLAALFSFLWSVACWSHVGARFNALILIKH